MCEYVFLQPWTFLARFCFLSGIGTLNYTLTFPAVSCFTFYWCFVCPVCLFYVRVLCALLYRLNYN